MVSRCLKSRLFPTWVVTQRCWFLACPTYGCFLKHRCQQSVLHQGYVSRYVSYYGFKSPGQPKKGQPATKLTSRWVCFRIRRQELVEKNLSTNACCIIHLYLPHLSHLLHERDTCRPFNPDDLLLNKSPLRIAPRLTDGGVRHASKEAAIYNYNQRAAGCEFWSG